MKKIKLTSIFYLATIPLLISGGLSVRAEDGSSQISRKSTINFFETKVSEKPKTSGVLPQTGEIISQYAPYIIGFVLILLVIFLLIKRRKKHE